MSSKRIEIFKKASISLKILLKFIKKNLVAIATLIATQGWTGHCGNAAIATEAF
jgi:hypothetical protein